MHTWDSRHFLQIPAIQSMRLAAPFNNSTCTLQRSRRQDQCENTGTNHIQKVTLQGSYLSCSATSTPSRVREASTSIQSTCMSSARRNAAICHRSSITGVHWQTQHNGLGSRVSECPSAVQRKWDLRFTLREEGGDVEHTVFGGAWDVSPAWAQTSGGWFNHSHSCFFPCKLP